MPEDLDQTAALIAFDRAHAAFVAEMAVETTPAAALRYRPDGEDYALGGLIVHVAQVLEKYARLLEVMRAADGRPVAEPPSPASQVDATLVRDGFDEQTRPAVLGRVAAAHARIVDSLQARPEDAFRRASQVTYTGTTEPFDTSPADVLGWVEAHYGEHVVQVADLRSAWASAL